MPLGPRGSGVRSEVSRHVHGACAYDHQVRCFVCTTAIDRRPLLHVDVYMRKVKVYGHGLTVWPSAMVVAAPADENFDIGAEAERLD